MVATAKATRNGSQAMPPTSPAMSPGDGVDAGAEDVADDEQQQQLGPHHPLELGLVRLLVGRCRSTSVLIGPPCRWCRSSTLRPSAAETSLGVRQARDRQGRRCSSSGSTAAAPARRSTAAATVTGHSDEDASTTSSTARPATAPAAPDASRWSRQNAASSAELSSRRSGGATAGRPARPGRGVRPRPGGRPPSRSAAGSPVAVRSTTTSGRAGHDVRHWPEQPDAGVGHVLRAPGRPGRTAPPRSRATPGRRRRPGCGRRRAPPRPGSGRGTRTRRRATSCGARGGAPGRAAGR